MDSLRGVFPRSQPPAKRDFLKENVARIRVMQQMSKPRSSKDSKFAIKPRERSSTRYCEGSNGSANRAPNSNLAICSSKAITNLRKSMSTMSLGSREFGTQTVDPESDEYFLKDTIIRYPSASTVRSVNQSHSQTCSRGHQMAETERRTRSNRDEYSDKMDRHLSNLSEYIERGAISKQKKPTSILKSSSLQKLNKNSINESQQQEDRSKRVASATQRSARIETVEISDDDNESQEDEIVENKKELEASQEKKKERGGGDSDSIKKQQQLKAAAEDPDCPDGHVPLSDDERLESLKIAKKRFAYLVDDLNRLPMTCETLRVRNRKIEIEKELRSLEVNIRVFSRPKVYVKLTE